MMRDEPALAQLAEELGEVRQDDQQKSAETEAT
jgi:hypothetical protein